MLEIELDIIQRELDQGNEVVVLYCDGIQISCDVNKSEINQSQSKRICRECISRRKKSLDWLDEGRGRLLSISHNTDFIGEDYRKKWIELISKANSYEFDQDYFNLRAPRVFDAAVSSLMTNIRDSNPNLQKYAERFYKYLNDAINSRFLALELIKIYNPKNIYIYNGRTAWYQPWVNAAETLKNYFTVYEYPNFGFENYLLHFNSVDHDLTSRSRAYLSFIEAHSIIDDEVLKVGEAWFISRIDKKKQGFEPVYASKQKIGKIPFNKDTKRFILSFFVSSQDELNALKNYQNNVAKTQYELLKIIIDNFKFIQIFIRIHPNLTSVDSNFVDQLHKLNNDDNIIVIAPDSSVDSYELIRNSNLVISCGSTVGVEAAYLGAPSLLVGGALFEKFNCCNIATTKNHFINSITDAINGTWMLFPDKQDAKKEACRFAYAFINFGTKPKYYSRSADYYHGIMIRDGKAEVISASINIIIMNRFLDFSLNTQVIIKRILKNPRNYLNLSIFTWKNFKNFIFPAIPRR